MINRSTQGLTSVTLQRPTLGMQPHNLALQPSSLSTHSPVSLQHLFCRSGRSSLFGSCLVISQVPLATSHVLVRMCMCAAVIGEETKQKKRGMFTAFLWARLKKEFCFQSNLHLILRGWPAAYTILHCCSAHAAQGELSLFYYRSGNLGPISLAFVLECFVLWQVTPFIQTRHKGPIATQKGGKGEC